MSFTISNLAALTGSQVDGDSEKTIDSVATLKDAQSRDLAFLVNAKYLDDAKHTNAGIIVISPSNWQKLKIEEGRMERNSLSEDANNFSVKTKPRNYLIHSNPYLAFAKIVQHIVSSQKQSVLPGVDSRAVISATASVAKTARIAPFVTIEDGAVIGENVEIDSHCFIGKNASISENSKIFSNVVIYQDCQVGKRCIIHSGSIIGADGFGFAADFESSSTKSPDPNLVSYSHKPSGKWVKLPQLGKVQIGNDVEIGANTTVDRGTLADTIIEDGVKIDNLVQIAHNCKIGAHTVIAACTGVAGSTTIGRFCMLGGAVGIAGHLVIADRVVITGKSGVSKSLLKPGIYASTFPAVPRAEWNRNVVLLRKLDELRNKLKQLEEQLSKNA